MPVLAQILVVCITGSALSLALAATIAFRVQMRWVPTLVAYAVGALLGAVFIDILPHLFEESRKPARIAAFILVGLLIFFMLEKLLLWRHAHVEDEGEGHAHTHDSQSSGWIVVAGDAFHNFTDGVIIASAFMADVKLGIVTALAIIAHEIPHEIGDFLVLLHSGFGRRKALLVNLLSGLATVLGALIAYAALRHVQEWVPEILAIAAASMIYVAVADLIPGLHKRTALGESLLQVAFIALGIGTIWLVHVVLFPEN